ncbi:MAG: hypothetical protein IJU98_04860 [Synergistaceae bacterium]|nr:hypothetical protein [Synergistaceae bacterium]
MRKFLALLMAGMLLVSCAGAALAVHDGTSGTSTPSTDSLVPEMTQEQKEEATNTAVEALSSSGNSAAAEAFKNTTAASDEEIKSSITQATTEEAAQSAEKATGELASQGREVRGDPVALGTVSFPETRLVFLAVVLPNSMQVGDLLTLIKNAVNQANQVSIAADDDATVFLDSAGKETKVVPADRQVTVATIFEGGKTYQPVVAASTESTKKSGGSSSGCDAGFGTLALMAVAFLGVKKFF